MKKFLSLLCAGLIVFLMFGTPGNAAASDECSCDVAPILGAEKNKIISDLLKSDEFKMVKQKQMAKGLKWTGVKDIEVLINYSFDNTIMVGVPFTTEDGLVDMAVFFNGQYMDPDKIPTDNDQDDDHELLNSLFTQ